MGYKKELKICEYCNKEFLGIKTRKYCSQECSHNSRKRRKKLICEECGIEFEVQDYRDAKFCSYECKNKNQSSDIIEIFCDNCGESFLRKEHKINETHNFCCKNCSDIFNSGSNHYEWKDYNHINGLKDALRKWGKSVKIRDNYTCQKCGNTNPNIQQAHHIIPKCKDRSLIFDENNGITLCIYCHYKEHDGDVNAQRLINEYIKIYEVSIKE